MHVSSETDNGFPGVPELRPRDDEAGEAAGEVIASHEREGPNEMVGDGSDAVVLGIEQLAVAAPG